MEVGTVQEAKVKLQSPKDWKSVSWGVLPFVALIIVCVYIRKHNPGSLLQVGMTSLSSGIAITALGTEILTNISSVCDLDTKKFRLGNVFGILAGFIGAAALMIGVRAAKMKKEKKDVKKDYDPITVEFVATTGMEFFIKAYLVGLTLSEDRIAAIPLVIALGLGTAPVMFSRIRAYQALSFTWQLIVMFVLAAAPFIGLICGFASFEAMKKQHGLHKPGGKFLLSFSAVVFLWSTVEDSMRWVIGKEAKCIKTNGVYEAKINSYQSSKTLLVGSSMFFVGVLVMLAARWGHKCHGNIED